MEQKLIEQVKKHFLEKKQKNYNVAPDILQNEAQPIINYDNYEKLNMEDIQQIENGQFHLSELEKDKIHQFFYDYYYNAYESQLKVLLSEAKVEHSCSKKELSSSYDLYHLLCGGAFRYIDYKYRKVTYKDFCNEQNEFDYNLFEKYLKSLSEKDFELRHCFKSRIEEYLRCSDQKYIIEFYNLGGRSFSGSPEAKLKFCENLLNESKKSLPENIQLKDFCDYINRVVQKDNEIKQELANTKAKKAQILNKIEENDFRKRKLKNDQVYVKYDLIKKTLIATILGGATSGGTGVVSYFHHLGNGEKVQEKIREYSSIKAQELNEIYGTNFSSDNLLEQVNNAYKNCFESSTNGWIVVKDGWKDFFVDYRNTSGFGISQKIHDIELANLDLTSVLQDVAVGGVGAAALSFCLLNKQNLVDKYKFYKLNKQIEECEKQLQKELNLCENVKDELLNKDISNFDNLDLSIYNVFDDIWEAKERAYAEVNKSASVGRLNIDVKYDDDKIYVTSEMLIDKKHNNQNCSEKEQKVL